MIKKITLCLMMMALMADLFGQGLSGTVVLANGAKHVLSVSCDGTVSSWGSNVLGQLGDGTTGTVSNPIARKVVGVGNTGTLNNVFTVAAGTYHNIALLCDGSVVTWGSNNKGQLGDGTLTNSSAPVLVKGLPANTKAIAIAAGDAHTMVVLNDGSVWAWGGNQYGQLGDGTNTEQHLPVQVKDVGGTGFLIGVLDVAAGLNSSLALMNDGTVRAWGNNNKGQLGIGSTAATQFSPEKVKDTVNTGDLSKVIKISSGNEFSLFLLSNNIVVACGNRASGQLGDVIANTTQNFPQSVKKLKDVVQIKAGYDGALAIKKDSTVWGWGENQFGALSLSDAITHSGLVNQKVVPPNQVHFRNPSLGGGLTFPLKGVVSVALGLSDYNDCFSTFVSLNNPLAKVLSSGINTSGQCGSATFGSVFHATPNNNVNVLTPATTLLTGNFSADLSASCNNGSVTYTISGSNGTVYNWDFGAGASPATSTSAGPVTVTYATTGPKTVKLTISNNSTSPAGCATCAAISQPITITKTFNVNVGGGSGDFVMSNPISCVKEGINFYPLNTDTINTRYTWTFGAGANPATSTAPFPKGIVYSGSGAKVITLTISNAACGNFPTVTKILTINPSPKAAFAFSSPVCEGEKINFTNTSTSGAGINYLWDFGPAAIPNATAVQVPVGISFSTGGTMPVKLSVTNQFGCKADTSSALVVQPKPKANFSSTAPVCSGLAVDFSNISNNTLAGVNYKWNFGSGASPANAVLQNPTGIVYSSAGIKTISLVASIAGNSCKDSISQTITIHETPKATFTSTAPQCSNAPVSFTNTGSQGTNWSYSWNFGVGASPSMATTENPNAIVYSSGGSKKVSFTVTDGICTKSDTQTVVINPSPLAAFASSAPICSGVGVDFTNTGSTSGVTYLWNFGVGATPATASTANAMGVVYSNGGIKNVSLVISAVGNACKDSITKTITIYQSPTAAFASTAPQCSNSPVNFTNNGSHGSNWAYNWSFGPDANPATSSAENPSGIIYSAGGNKKVTLTITDGICSKTDTQTVIIQSSPIAAFATTAPVCTGIGVDFTNQGTNSGVSYDWNFGTGALPASSSSQNQVGVIYTTAGTKKITLVTTSTSNGCKDSLVQTITINQSPTVSFVSTAPRCPGTPVNFTNTGSTGGNWSYNWSFGNDGLPATSGAENPSGIIYNKGGNKKVTLTITNGLCTKTDTMSLVIYPSPTADAGKDTTICSGTSVQIGSNALTNLAYQWFPVSTLNNALISNPLATPIAPITLYIVSVKNTITGCSSSDTAVVTLLAPLVADAGMDGKICKNDSIQVGVGKVPGQLYSWTPATGLNNVNASNPNSSPAATTVYTLTVTGHGCPPVTDEVKIVVNPLPKIDAGPNDTATTLGASVQLIASGGVQYTWTPAQGLDNAGVYNPIASPQSTTIYLVTGVDIFGCTNKDSIKVTVILPTFWAPTAFTPDGSGHNDQFYIRGTGIIDFEFRIYNEWGEEVFFSKDINLGWDGKRQTGGEDLPQGAYIYSVRGTLTDGTNVNKKDIVNLIR